MQRPEVVVSGMSCRAAGAKNVSELSSLLFSGSCGVSQIPPDRWRSEPFLHPNRGVHARSYSFAAGLIDDIWGFDAAAFGLSPREAAMMDPQQRILLKLVWEAFEDAGMDTADLDKNRTGVYVGVSSSDYSRRLAEDPLGTSDPYLMVGNALSIVANRISHVFDFNGPSLAIDTACSSSLVALDRAYSDLLAGKIDTAVVGGINILLIPDAFAGFSHAGMLSERGLCQSFSANADGYVRGEGGGVLILQRLDVCKTLKGNPRAKVLASAVNTDGKTVGIALPSEHGQYSLLSAVYEENDIDPNSLLFVEAHGTGTLAGDPIEARALGQALGQKRSEVLPIGSIKSNIGHLEPASGVLGVIKAIVSLEENRFPASLHAQEPNPDIDFDGLNLKLAQETIAINKTETSRAAGISSFGFGGVNAHVIIEASSDSGMADADSGEYETRNVLTISAKSERSLQVLLEAYADLRMDEIKDVSRVINQSFHHRGTFDFKAAILANAPEDLSREIGSCLESGSAPGIVQAETPFVSEPAVFVYSGNGAQYAGMCVNALQQDALYSGHFKQIDELYADLCGWSICDVVHDLEVVTKLNAAQYAQPLLFADQVAQTFALRDRGFEAAAVLGHSGGEMAAATCSGVLSLEQALKTIYERSKSQETMRGRGGMAAVQTSEEKTNALLREFDVPELTISAINSPKSVTVVGPNEPLDAFLKWLRKAKRIAGVNLRLEYPYHSPMLDEIEGAFRAGVKTLNPVPANVPYYSSVFGRKIVDEPLDVDYWWRLIRSPVEFSQATQCAIGDGFKMFVECGPKPVLLNYLQDTIGDQNHRHDSWHTCDDKTPENINPISLALAKAIAHGAQLDEKTAFGNKQTYDRSLPGYCWDEIDLRADNTAQIDNYYAINGDYAPLLGRETFPGSNVWLSEIDTHLFPKLADHVIGGNAIMPAAGYLDIALCAVQRANQLNMVELNHVDIVAPMPLSASNIRQVKTEIDTKSRTFFIESRVAGTDDEYQLHMTGRFATDSPNPQAKSAICESFSADYDEADFQDVGHLYDFGKKLGLDYGPQFRRVEAWRVLSGTTADVRLMTSDPDEDASGRSCIDYADADAVFHGLLPLLEMTNEFTEDFGFIPVYCESVQLFQPDEQIAFGRITLKRIGTKNVKVDCTYLSADKEPIAVLSGLRLQAIKLVDDLSFDKHLFHMRRVQLTDFSQGNAESESIIRPQALIDGIDALRSEFENSPEDQDNALVEAISIAIAYEAVSELCNDRRAVSRPLVSEASASARELLQDKLLRILVAAGLAEQVDGEMFLAEESGLPQAHELIASLVDEKPYLASEHRLLAFLNQEIRPTLVDAVPWNPQSRFGGNRLSELLLNTTAAKHRIQAGCQILEVAVASLKDGDRANILVVAEESIQSIVDWSAQLPYQDLAIEHVKTSGLLEFLDKNGSADKANDDDKYDMVLLLDGLLLDKAGTDGFERVKACLRPAAGAISLQQNYSVFRNLFVGDDLTEVETEVSLFGGMVENLSAEQVEDYFVHQGADVHSVQKLPAYFGNRTAVVFGFGEAPKQTNAIADETSSGSFSTTLEEVLFDLGFEQLSENADKTGKSNMAVFSGNLADTEGLSGTAQHHVLLVEPVGANAGGDPAALTTDRIMDLSAHLLDHQSRLSRLTLVIPGGASYAGRGDCDPVQVAIWNLCRTIQNEAPNIAIHLIDASPNNLAASQARSLGDILSERCHETELLLDRAGLFALRVETGLSSKTDSFNARKSEKLVLQAPISGRLDQLRWHEQQRPKPSGNQVEIEVNATGLNYRDVMWSMGLLPEEALEDGLVGPEIGMECAGRVVAVGNDVNDLKVGDLVMAVGSGCFASHILVDVGLCMRLPSNLDLLSAATLPVAYFTAHYTLVELANLREGDSVLIHGAAGGVGFAALQVAASRGAEIFATAGTLDKRALLETLDVDHVLDSRSAEFASAVMQLTNDQGVDVVLNSLAGEKMELSLQVLKPFGRFLEIGKQDFFSNTKVGLRPFRANISYHGIDVDQLMAHRPNLVSRLLEDVAQKFEMGEYGPIPYYSFNASDAKGAFRFMQRSNHIGKVIVEAPDRFTAVHPADEKFTANAAGTYVVVGGAGGLGRELVIWLLASGAKSVAVLGRSANDDISARLENLGEFNGKVSYFQCDASNKAELERTLEVIRSDQPIVGVIHAAMHLQDAPLDQLTRDDVSNTLSAKVAAISNLDELSRSDELTHFIAISSVAAFLGNQRQAAYVAANAYLEAVILQRGAAGLPGFSIGLGAINDVGYLTENKAAMAMLSKMSGRSAFTSTKILKALSRLLANSTIAKQNPVVVLADLDWGAVASQLKTLRTPTFKALFRLGSIEIDGAQTDNLRSRLEKISISEGKETLTKYIQSEIASVLNLATSKVNVNVPVAELGMDSLMGIEFGMSMQEMLGQDIPMTTVSDGASITEIAERLMDHISRGRGEQNEDSRLTLRLMAEHIDGSGDPDN